MNAKLKVWGSDLIEPATLVQAERTARLPVVEGVRLMPDAHIGKGATVGSVVATRNAIIPAAVGVDIGCGMAALRTDIVADQLPDSLDALLPRVAKAVPAGVGVAKRGENAEGGRWMGDHGGRFSRALESALQAKAIQQMGSLGSGNHFLEVDVDEDDRVWLVLHSGSRGIGNILGSEHIKTASQLAKEAHIILEDRDLAWLDEGTDTFAMYVNDMLLCQDYARVNRAVMLDSAFGAFREWLGRDVVATDRINCHHNFAQREEHDGHQVWVTRKGAIQATEGQLGIIPGSMGDKTYIISGRGNADSYHSCAHGAGRQRSRGQAKRELNTRDLTRRMRGITWMADRANALLDEHPSAYKDIDRVMAAQRDLVVQVHTLKQILNYKGL
ncbi:MAG: RtcB family protein [Acidimicrobiales bacterium]